MHRFVQHLTDALRASLLIRTMVIIAVVLSVVMIDVGQAGSVSFLLVSLSALLFGDCLEILICCLSRTPPRSRAPLPDLLKTAGPAPS